MIIVGLRIFLIYAEHGLWSRITKGCDTIAVSWREATDMVLDGSIVHTLIGIGFAGMGWAFKTQWDSLRQLDDKVDVLQIRVAAEYVKREELREEFKRLFAKLDTIEHKLDQKADK